MSTEANNLKNATRIALVADIHVGSGEPLLAHAVALCNGLDLDAVVVMGDLAEPTTEENFAKALAGIGGFEAPVYLMLGNIETSPEGAALNAEERLRETFPGPWQESFTYGFRLGGWRFIVLGGIRHVPVDIRNFYVKRVKGFVNRASNILSLADDDRERFMQLLDESGDHPTCVLMHVPVAPLSDRLAACGAMDQGRMIEVRQLQALIAERPNVYAVLTAHMHLNQVDVVRGQLHCWTQNLAGRRSNPPAIRVVELADAAVSGRLLWDDRVERPPGEVGTAAGDHSFIWSFK